MTGLALACGGASALNHVLDADIDRLMGKRTEKRPVAAGRVTPARALEFGLTLSALSFVLLASTVNVLTAALALVGNLFYVARLHALAEALDAAEHRHRRRGRRGAAARRLRGRDREPRPAGALALPDRLPLDAAALLGARAADQGELRGGEGADAARRPRRRARPRGRSSSYSVVLVAFTLARRLLARPALLGRGGCARRRLPRPGVAAPARRRRGGNAGVLFHYSLLYLALLFVAAALNPVLL